MEAKSIPGAWGAADLRPEWGQAAAGVTPLSRGGLGEGEGRGYQEGPLACLPLPRSEGVLTTTACSICTKGPLEVGAGSEERFWLARLQPLAPTFWLSGS